MERIEAEVAGTDLGVDEIRPITPSLEDVFVSLTEHEEDKRAGGAA